MFSFYIEIRDGSLMLGEHSSCSRPCSQGFVGYDLLGLCEADTVLSPVEAEAVTAQRKQREDIQGLGVESDLWSSVSHKVQ